jgi:hypothetical protein
MMQFPIYFDTHLRTGREAIRLMTTSSFCSLVAIPIMGLISPAYSEIRDYPVSYFVATIGTESLFSGIFVVPAAGVILSYLSKRPAANPSHLSYENGNM